MELESLVIPEADAAEKSGQLILDLPKLWQAVIFTFIIPIQQIVFCVERAVMI